jgi:two-component system, NarL family, sensor histidine kinase UhpB
MIATDVLQEPARLDALRRLALANLEPEEPFDRLTRLAASLCSAPTALLTFVDQGFEHFKSAQGLRPPLAGLRRVSLDYSLSRFVLATQEALVVRDARHHPVLGSSPPVTDLGVVACAAVPLITSDGHCLGAIAALDPAPREWTDEQVAGLRDLAAAAVDELELRWDLADHRRVEAALRHSETRYRSLVEQTSDIITVIDESAVVLYGSPSVTPLLGYDPEDLVGRRAVDLVHPDDVARVLEAHRRALGDPTQAQRGVEFRCRHRNGSWRVLEALGSVMQYRSAGPQAVLTLRDVTEVRGSHEQLRQLAHRLDEVREEELTRLSREIHDELGHALTALRLDLGWLAPRLRRNREPVPRKVGEMLALVDDTIDSVRRIAARLRPPVLEDLGLAAALDGLLQRFARQTGIAVELEADAVDVPPAARRALYRIGQEALTNVARHAQAGSVRVRLASEPDSLLLEIADDGVGIRPGMIQNTGSLGLVGMRERATALRASFEVLGGAGAGTTVRVVMRRPRPRAEGAA